MTAVAKTVVFLAGALVVLGTLGSAMRTVVLPRGMPAHLAAAVFATVRRLFELRLRRSASYDRRDQVMAPYGPTSLLLLALVWLAIALVGYTAMFWALGGRSLRDAVVTSGSSLLTLGFVRPQDMPSIVLAIIEAITGLALLALLITYLPSLYTAFSRREAAVARLEVRAGAPPSGPEMIERYARIGWLGGLGAIWDTWEGWFVELEETHTSFPALVFFRSPQPDHSWITAAGAVLDAAALMSSTLEENDPDAELCLRAGYLALRRIADFFEVPYDNDPAPDDPISVSRDEYDAAYDRLAAAGIRLEPPTATRRGAPSPDGGSTTTRCSPSLPWSWPRTRPGRRTSRSPPSGSRCFVPGGTNGGTGGAAGRSTMADCNGVRTTRRVHTSGAERSDPLTLSSGGTRAPRA